MEGSELYLRKADTGNIPGTALLTGALVDTKIFVQRYTAQQTLNAFSTMAKQYATIQECQTADHTCGPPACECRPGFVRNNGKCVRPQVCPKALRTASEPMNQPTPPPVIINPKKNHTSTVIFLHGLGDSGDGWADVFANEIRNDNTKYIHPSSASRPVTLNMGLSIPAWFDLYGLDANAREDSVGIAQAARLVHGMIDAEMATGIPSKKIILGGFSMGGALALYAGLTYPHKLAGIVGLSSFLIQKDKLPGNHTANKETPIFLGHGANDFIVPLSLGQLAEKHLKVFNPNVRLHVYDGMAHSSSAEELSDLKKFIDERINCH
ncbi:acyl-protein thioesterase 1 family protein [Teladorsagia circumcincta]|uniref:palmitoyl-protein hydrolase n=1 Tax=Teladorsagia circumcincta TaxID=45464 RepID=A0A2G9V3Q3_TELCI|nr:acyl-protein thioesterase 1 family protein [Teladorsagia circumcincta]